MYYDAVYCLWPNVQPLPINVDGECVLAEKVISMKKDKECNGNSLITTSVHLGVNSSQRMRFVYIVL